MLNEAVILAADAPRILTPVGGRPFIDHLVWNVRRHGVRRVVFVVGRAGEQVEAHVGDGAALGIEPGYVRGPEAMGTVAAAQLALPEIAAGRFLLLDGEKLFDLNYLDLALLADETGADVARALHSADDGGAYVVRLAALASLPDGGGPLVPPAARGSVVDRSYEGFFLDIGVPECLEESHAAIPVWRRKPAVFFDRDGVINEDVGFAHTPEEFRFLPGAPEAVKLVNDAGLLAFVVTNQTGIGRGYYTEDDFAAFTAWVAERLAEKGAHVDATYFCPHHPTEALGPYLRTCECRKPAPGMLLRAMAEWEVDVEASVFIGDRPSDAEAARRAGVASVTYVGGDLRDLVRDVLHNTAKAYPTEP